MGLAVERVYLDKAVMALGALVAHPLVPTLLMGEEVGAVVHLGAMEQQAAILAHFPQGLVGLEELTAAVVGKPGSKRLILCLVCVCYPNPKARLVPGLRAQSA